MRSAVLALPLLMLSLVPSAHAESKYIAVVLEATYEASEDDSKSDAIEKAKLKPEREAVEKIVGHSLRATQR